MSSPDTSAGVVNPWQAGLSSRPNPPRPPDLLAGSIVITQSISPDVGAQIVYFENAFYRCEWSVGSTNVPMLIELLTDAEIEKVRRELIDQLSVPGGGIDAVPLRAFLEALEVYLRPGSSERFADAIFGAITEQTSPSTFLSGTVSFPNGVIGSLLYEANRVMGETHLPALSPAAPTPLRVADLHSVVEALESALSGHEGIDPVWGRLLSLAQDQLVQTQHRAG